MNESSSPELQGQEANAQLLARLLAISDDAVVIADASARIVLFNEGAERMFGYSAAQMVGAPLDRLLPPAARARHHERMRAFAADGGVARRMGERGTIFGQRASGEQFAAEASISHIELAGHVYYAAFLRDVDQRQRASERLAASEARFRALAENSPVGVFETDAQGGLIYVNECWCRLSGMTPAQAAGAGWTRALHPEDLARVLDLWRAAIPVGRPINAEFRFVHADASETSVVAQALARGGAPGDGYIGTITDITESRRQAAALEKAMSEAQAAARAKSLFLANISHEIRTPLNAVIGMTSLLLDTPMSDEQRDFAQTIRASGETLLAVINDILDYSKADVGKIEIEREVFDLRRCVEESLDLVTPRAIEKRLNLACVIEDGTPGSLIGDAARLRQVLVNLLSNAVKFTLQGEVLVSVDAVPLADDLWRVHFAVKDTGIGIAREHLPRLFQSFSQVDASTTRRFGGTGLGLAISKRLAELMGGQVWVDSEPGRGSVFHVTIAAEAGPPLDLPHLRGNPPVLAGKRLLIVDDHLTNRRILVKQALAWGMQPTALPSALEALDRVRHGEAFDVALLDMSMPDMDGMDLAVEIRRHRSAEQLPIMILTSIEQRADLHAAPVALAAYLRKPLKAAQLFGALVLALGGAADTAPPAPPSAARGRLAERLPLRVLVAEDNAMNQKVAISILARLGYRADLAANGLEVMAAVKRQPYDVVLMDIQMPEMDGLQAARWIMRERGDDVKPHVIAMTAHAMPGDRETYLAAGMDGYIAKPIDPAELAAVLQRLGQASFDGDGGSAAPGHAGVDGDDRVIDRQRLEHLRTMQDDSQPQLVRELIDMFVADAPAHLDSIAQAATAADADRLRMAAHRFLSVTENIGAGRMSQLCRLLELSAKARSLDQANTLVKRLRTEFERAQAMLLAERIRY